MTLLLMVRFSYTLMPKSLICLEARDKLSANLPSLGAVFSLVDIRREYSMASLPAGTGTDIKARDLPEKKDLRLPRSPTFLGSLKTGDTRTLSVASARKSPCLQLTVRSETRGRLSLSTPSYESAISAISSPPSGRNSII